MVISVVVKENFEGNKSSVLYEMIRIVLFMGICM